MTERLGPIEGSVRAFVGAVLDRSPSIGVRGELTYDYLRGLGFRDVEVIGCPSMFFHGDRMAIEKRTPTLDTDAALAINVTPYVKRMAKIVTSHHARYPNLRYQICGVVLRPLGRGCNAALGSPLLVAPQYLNRWGIPWDKFERRSGGR